MKKLLLVLGFYCSVAAAQEFPYFVLDAAIAVSDTNVILYTNNLIFRYDPKLGATNNGDLISFLPDQTTNHYDLNSTGTTRPYYTNDTVMLTTNGYIQFTAANATFLRTNTSDIIAQPITCVFVCNRPAPVNGTAFSSKSGVNCCLVEQVNGINSYGIYAGTPLASGVTHTNALKIYILKYNGSSSVFKVNGVDSVTGNAGTASFNPVVFGVRDTSSFACDWKLAYALAYHENVSDSNLTNICTWYIQRFGLDVINTYIPP